MEMVTKRELNQHTAQVLAQVESDGAVVVTERGVPRWRIDVVGGDADPVARLRAEGKIVPAKADPAPWPRQRRRYTPAQIDALLADVRGDR